jgi:uncharacterized membrane protein YjjP (DUF1212 family)
MQRDDWQSRTDFITELARSLHEAGTTAPRLEQALTSVARKLSMKCDVWSSPTAIILTLNDMLDQGERTRVLRMAPGDVDLKRLCLVDEIAERVLSGELDVTQGRSAMAELRRPPSTLRRWTEALVAFPMASMGVAAILKGTVADILVAGLIGLGIGIWTELASRRARLAQAIPSLSALLAALVTGVVAHFVALSTKLVLLAGLIVLVPGLSLTSAAVEIASQHLVSGGARLLGAIATLLKLAFGALVGSELIAAIHFEALPLPSVRVPAWQEWPALLFSALSFAMLFRARLRDWPIVIMAAVFGYVTLRFTSQSFSPEVGTFLAAFLVCLASNIYARWMHRPGALIRLPGIILLVPGSVGFKSLSFLIEKDVFLGLDTAVSLLLILASLAAGLLMANTVLSARNAL